MKKITINPDITKSAREAERIKTLPLAEAQESMTNLICGFSPESIAYMKKLDREKAAKRQQRR
jgi:hypothetical protein